MAGGDTDAEDALSEGAALLSGRGANLLPKSSARFRATLLGLAPFRGDVTLRDGCLVCAGGPAAAAVALARSAANAGLLAKTVLRFTEGALPSSGVRDAEEEGGDEDGDAEGMGVVLSAVTADGLAPDSLRP